MSSTKVIANLRVDSVLKEQAGDIAQQMGLSLSTVMSILLRKFVRERKLEIGLDENGFTPEKRKIMKSALEEVRTVGKKIKTIDDLLDD
ncbi:MAG TPA: type II toxin-antitoxin system RelB/DinJ family antitoxin [Candidatus Absconditabacterales bacterium]|nr:type II toxin-antitoxin system RelB/DinJ family antitoxin [Candidatus Absconditabacterales bacterium]